MLNYTLWEKVANCISSYKNKLWMTITDSYRTHIKMKLMGFSGAPVRSSSMKSSAAAAQELGSDLHNEPNPHHTQVSATRVQPPELHPPSPVPI